VPDPLRQLTLSAARDLIARRCFEAAPASQNGAPASHGRVGLECEWHVRPLGAPTDDVPLHELRSWLTPLAPLPGGSSITYEPGGQLELSSAPCTGVGAAINSMAADRDLVTGLLEEHAVELVATGVDPLRAPRRQLMAPRYDAMEAFFDLDGPEGRIMMSRTASVQVNLDAGASDEMAEQRWRLVHRIGPPLAAAFANSPVALGKPTGWRSTRLANWFAMDATRTAPAYRPGVGPCESWVEYALAARVMLIRTGGDCYQPVRDGMTLADWLERGHPAGWPTEDDLDYHLTTLFPPIRPRGWLELRFLDALPDPWWRVAAAVTTACLDDEVCAGAAEQATEDIGHLWCEASSLGLTHPALAQAAESCFEVVLENVRRLGVDATTEAACADYFDRYVARGRCPADDWM
jgi:glutamate--cysteine ligase